ncbi:hypothetical protein HGM15179_005269 [Zosterops borbonicus]|uniref:Uncharacterized protein n=1 Tax=Zosterops borbonicus TaxID=364589 RepID=A0A8K1GQX4_9PASS|nr:hypothetical protein HGM15179_005269 [Zosterops borbonicus]
MLERAELEREREEALAELERLRIEEEQKKLEEQRQSQLEKEHAEVEEEDKEAEMQLQQEDQEENEDTTAEVTDRSGTPTEEPSESEPKKGLYRLKDDESILDIKLGARIQSDFPNAFERGSDVHRPGALFPFYSFIGILILDMGQELNSSWLSDFLRCKPSCVLLENVVHNKDDFSLGV